MMHRASRLSVSVAAAVLALAGLSACSKEEAKKPASQVVAKVDGEEISVHQLNAILQRTPNIAPEAVEGARKQVLDGLVTQQLAVAQALDKKLDRTPDVAMALEMARRDVLAKAYLEQAAAAAPAPSDADVRKYYDEHPQLFGGRKIYALQEMRLAPNPEIEAQLREKAAAGASMDDLAGMLRAKGVRFAPSAGSRPAEEIPLSVLPRVADAKNGQTVVLSDPSALYVIRVADSRAAPVAEQQALPLVKQVLANDAKRKAVSAEIARLKEKAKIEYVGIEAPKPAAAAPAAAPASPSAAAAPAVPNLEKGIAGLK